MVEVVREVQSDLRRYIPSWLNEPQQHELLVWLSNYVDSMEPENIGPDLFNRVVLAARAIKGAEVVPREDHLLASTVLESKFGGREYRVSSEFPIGDTGLESPSNQTISLVIPRPNGDGTQLEHIRYNPSGIPELGVELRSVPVMSFITGERMVGDNLVAFPPYASHIKDPERVRSVYRNMIGILTGQS